MAESNYVASQQYSFPNREVAESEKDTPQYNLSYARAIYHRWRTNKCAILYDDRENFQIARLYGKGDQPVSIYKVKEDEPKLAQSAVDLTGATKTRKGWENIIWDVVSPMPRIKTIVKGYIDQFGQDVFVDAIDARSGAMKESMKWRLYTQAKHMEFIAEYNMKAGIPTEELVFTPANITELNVYEAMGGFKLNYARAMQKLIRHTEQISQFDEDLRDRWADDLMDIGVIAGKVVYDPEIGKYKYRYSDPENVIMQYVRNGEYERSEYAGEVVPYTISELKQLMPDKPESYFTNIADSFKGKYNNKFSGDFDNFSKRMSTGTYGYDPWVVEVADVEWIDYECRKHLIYDSTKGRLSVVKLNLDTEVKPISESLVAKGAQQQVADTKMRKLRGAKWVVGTDCVFDTGPVEMQDRPKKSTVMLNYRLFVLKDPPIVQQLMPVADDMALAWYKYQAGRSIAVQAGYTVDVGMMNNIDSGKMDFSSVLKMWRKTGLMLHQQSITGDYRGGAVSPIQPIPSIMGDTINEWNATWDSALKRIEDLTGLNLIVLGSTVNPNAAVGTTQLSANSAIHVLKPVIDTIARMKTTLAETTMRRLQLACKARKDIIENYATVVGEADIELLVGAEKDAVQYGLMFHDRPSMEAKNNILQGAQLSLNNRRDGKPGITNAQYQYIVMELESGADLKELAALVSFMEAKSQQEEDAKQEQNIKLQGEMNQQAQQQKLQGDAATNQMKIQGEMATIDANNKASIQQLLIQNFPELFRPSAEAFAKATQSPQGNQQQPQGQPMGGGQEQMPAQPEMGEQPGMPEQPEMD